MLRIDGLVEIVYDTFITAKQIPVRWGMVAVEKDQLRKPRSADPAKKKARKRRETSKRRGR